MTTVSPQRASGSQGQAEAASAGLGCPNIWISSAIRYLEQEGGAVMIKSSGGGREEFSWVGVQEEAITRRQYLGGEPGGGGGGLSSSLSVSPSWVSKMVRITFLYLGAGL